MLPKPNNVEEAETRYPKITSPAPLDPSYATWFKIDSVNEDNFRFHLETSADNQAWLGAELAKAEYYMQVFEDAAMTRSARVYIEMKCKPFTRASAKAGKQILADCSDDLADRCGKADFLACRYRKAALEWRARRDTLRSYFASMTTKQVLISSMCGLKREEWASETASRRGSY